MMMQNHLLMGYALAKIVPNPFIGIPLAFASHFLLDLVTYPSKEMEILVQGELSSNRDKITFAFTESFLAVFTLIIILIIASKGQLDWYTLVMLITANLPDIFDSIIPLLRGKRKTIRYSHDVVITSNPYAQIIIHQCFTVLGFAFLVLF